MLLSEEDLFERLSHPSNISVLPLKDSGKGVGDTKLGVESKLLIGLLAGGEESQSSVGSTFNVAPSTVSKIVRGLSSDNNSLDGEFKDKLKDVSARVDLGSKTEDAHGLALNALVDTLNQLRPAIAGVTKARELSKIASDMSRVASTLSGAGIAQRDSSGNIINKVQVIVHAPQMRAERDFEVIEVK